MKGQKGAHEETLAALRKQGFVRARIDGTLVLLDEAPALERRKAHSIEVVIDRLVLPCDKTRLTDSVELALKVGKGVLKVEVVGNNRIIESSNNRIGSGESSHSINRLFDNSIISHSELNACLDCGVSFDDLKPRSFSFNSPFGACPTCSGLGHLYYFDEDLIVPDKTLPLRECIHPWRRAGHNAIMYYNALLEEIAKQNHVRLDTPYAKLPAKFRHDLMHGFKEDLVLPWRSVDRPFEGVLAVLKKRLEEAEDDETRAKYEAYQSERICPTCHGARLNAFSLAARLNGKSIADVMALPIRETQAFFAKLQPTHSSTFPPFNLSTSPKLAALRDVLSEITRRLQFLLDVGLDYLTLDRASSTLSGGEMQRIRLATQIGSGLTGVLYVLDEPTIGLHPRDNERLIATLKGLRDRGNTVVVVEHDAEMMRAADWIIDLGPGAGREGGELMYQGPYDGLLKAHSLTADYLTGKKQVSPQEASVVGDLRDVRDASDVSPARDERDTRDGRVLSPLRPSRLSRPQALNQK